MLSELILLITQIITKEFDDIVSKIDFNESLLDKIDFIYNEVDVQKEYNTIQMECLNILNK